MADLNILYKREYRINDKIKIIIPSVGEILDNVENYYSAVSTLTAVPIDLMAPLDDAGIDFTTINEYDLFLLLFNGLKSQDVSLIFGDDFDITAFEMSVNKQNGMTVLYDEKNGIVIDRAIHGLIADILRKIHGIEKNRKKPANPEAKAYMIERAKVKMRRQKNKPYKSQLEQLIVSMVNTEQFKYNFETVRDITIFQFNESVKQVVKKVNYDNLMHRVYFGTVNSKNLQPDELNWLTHK